MKDGDATHLGIDIGTGTGTAPIVNSFGPFMAVERAKRWSTWFAVACSCGSSTDAADLRTRLTDLGRAGGPADDRMESIAAPTLT